MKRVPMFRGVDGTDAKRAFVFRWVLFAMHAVFQLQLLGYDVRSILFLLAGKLDQRPFAEFMHSEHGLHTVAALFQFLIDRYGPSNVYAYFEQEVHAKQHGSTLTQVVATLRQTYTLIDWFCHELVFTSRNKYEHVVKAFDDGVMFDAFMTHLGSTHRWSTVDTFKFETIEWCLEHKLLKQWVDPKLIRGAISRG